MAERDTRGARPRGPHVQPTRNTGHTGNMRSASTVPRGAPCGQQRSPSLQPHHGPPKIHWQVAVLSFGSPEVRYRGCTRPSMPPKGKKKGSDEADDLGLPAEGAAPIRGPDDAIQRLKEKSLLDRVAALYVTRRAHSVPTPTPADALAAGWDSQPLLTLLTHTHSHASLPPTRTPGLA
jgi:hypothetical protein